MHHHQRDSGWLARDTLSQAPQCPGQGSSSGAVLVCTGRPCPRLYSAHSCMGSKRELSFPFLGMVSSHPKFLIPFVFYFHSFAGEFPKYLPRANKIVIFLPAQIFAFQLGSFFMSKIPSLEELFNVPFLWHPVYFLLNFQNSHL